MRQNYNVKFKIFPVFSHSSRHVLTVSRVNGGCSSLFYNMEELTVRKTERRRHIRPEERGIEASVMDEDSTVYYSALWWPRIPRSSLPPALHSRQSFRIHFIPAFTKFHHCSRKEKKKYQLKNMLDKRKYNGNSF